MNIKCSSLNCVCHDSLCLGVTICRTRASLASNGASVQYMLSDFAPQSASSFFLSIHHAGIVVVGVRFGHGFGQSGRSFLVI